MKIMQKYEIEITENALIMWHPFYKCFQTTINLVI